MRKKENKKSFRKLYQNSVYNAISALALTLTNGLLSIVVTRYVIARFGSDFNGLNSTANQIVNVLLVLEGGFTLASNVALFSPLTKRDYAAVNGLLTATKRKFRQIGAVFFAVGLLAAGGYAFAVNSGLPRTFIATVIIMTVVPAAFNLFYATTYRVLLQTQQKEYIINLITMLTVGLGHISNIAMIALDGPMWMVRFNTMVFSLLNSVVIAGYVKHKNKYLDLNVPPRAELIKGTGDVMIQKITGVIYSSAPIVFLSISPTGGTVLASVYAVYNNIFTMVKSLLHGVIDAPRLGFGQILTERSKEEVWPIYAQYEYLAFSAIFVLLTTAYSLILPFITLYTQGIADTDYRDAIIVLFMTTITAVEMMHIPSGHLINMAGRFKISRNIQSVVCVVLLVAMPVGGTRWGIYGMLAAVLLAAVLLAVMEIGYVHIYFFDKKIMGFVRLILPLALAGIGVCGLESQFHISMKGYLSFAGYGIVFVILHGTIAIIVSFIFNREKLPSLFNRMKHIIMRSKR